MDDPARVAVATVMTSLLMLCRLECRLLRRDPVSWWAAALVVVAGVAAIGLGEARYHRRLEQQAEIRATEEAKVTRLRARAALLTTDPSAIGPQELALELAWGARTPGYANAWTQLSALQQPVTLSVLAAGVSEFYPAGYGTSWRDVEPEPMPLDPREPTLARAGWFDLSFVLLYLLPLAIVASSVDLLAREREAGTWALIRSHPVSTGRILAIKLASRAALIVACLVVLGLIAAWRTGDPVGVLAWQTVAVAYAAWWFACALLISVRVHHPGAAAAAGCVAWFTIAVVLPGAIDTGVARAIPAPTTHALTMASRAARAAVAFDSTEAQAEAALLADDGQALAMRTRFLARFPEYRDEARLSTWGRYAIVQAAKEEALDALVAPLRRQQAAAADRREAWLSRLSWASPTLAASRAFWAMANVDQRAQADFQAQARTYDRRWKAFFWPLMFSGADFRPDDYDRIPRFSHRLPTADEQRALARVTAVVLLTPVIMIGTLLWRALSQ